MQFCTGKPLRKCNNLVWLMIVIPFKQILSFDECQCTLKTGSWPSYPQGRTHMYTFTSLSTEFIWDKTRLRVCAYMSFVEGHPSPTPLRSCGHYLLVSLHEVYLNETDLHGWQSCFANQHTKQSISKHGPGRPDTPAQHATTDFHISQRMSARWVWNVTIKMWQI